MKVWIDANLPPNIALYAHRVFPELGPLGLATMFLSAGAPVVSYVLAKRFLASGKSSVGLSTLGTLLIPVGGCVYLFLQLGPFLIFLPIAFFPISLVPLILYPVAAFNMFKAYGKWFAPSQSGSVEQTATEQNLEEPEALR